MILAGFALAQPDAGVLRVGHIDVVQAEEQLRQAAVVPCGEPNEVVPMGPDLGQDQIDLANRALFWLGLRTPARPDSLEPF